MMADVIFLFSPFHGESVARQPIEGQDNHDEGLTINPPEDAKLHGPLPIPRKRGEGTRGYS